MPEITRGLRVRGKRLWAALLEQDTSLADELNPAREIAFDACATTDNVAWLTRAFNAEKDPDRKLRLLGELRQQRTAAARLISALRLPDETSGRRPQRRQLRGVQQPAKVSSLDRARQLSGR